MSTVTLAESAKLSQDELVIGVIENVITVNPIFEVLPFVPVEGNALAFNRENALGDVQMAQVGDAITAKTPASFTQVTVPLTTILGDAEVNGLIQATRSGKQDQRAIQVASKAKSVARKFQDQWVNGTGVAPQFSGLLALVDAAKKVQAGAAAGAVANGNVLSFAEMDAAIDLVTDKDGECDFFMMHGRTIRSYLALLRALGGASIGEVVTMPSGRQVPAYRGIPIFRNDWIPTTQTQGATNTCTTAFVGTFDDGSQMHGVSGLHAANAVGIQVKNIGEKEAADEDITRVKWYCAAALYSLNGLAAITGLTN